AVLGAATSPLADMLLERGARLVHVYDADAGRVAEASARRAGAKSSASRPVIAHFESELGVRDGAFDAVIVSDLSEWPEAEQVVKTVRRLLSPAGVAFFSSPNPEAERFLLPPSAEAENALGYYDLYDAVSLQFSEVRMLGQAPFVGYSIVDFSEEDPEVAVDTSIVDEPEAPEWYVAVAGERLPVGIGYALVELPLAGIADAMASEPVTLRGGEKRDRRTIPSERDLALTEAEARIAVLVTENDRLREELTQARRAERSLEQASMRAAELDRELETVKRRLSDAERDVSMRERAGAERGEARVREAEQRADALAKGRAELESRVAETESRARAAERRVADAEGRATDLESRAKTADARANAADARRKELEAKVAAASDTLKDLETKLAAERRARGEAELTVSKLSAEIEAAAARAKQRADDASTQADLEAEIKKLEGVLRERGHEINRLKRDIGVAEQLGKELLFELEEARALGSGGPSGGSAFGAGGGTGVGGGVTGSGQSLSAAATPGLDAAAAEVLAERAARAEADVVATEWRIAQLERELARRGGGADVASRRERELERALVLAQRELAEARSRGEVEPDASRVAAATEHLVLREQVAGATGSETHPLVP
ncbi:MAG TPA: methyltransferase domain-containing protein, partial [Polyangiaceae bacterium]|nr:methyltransferase domain-containing protein [Polyangiaceae bacterium]